MAPTRQSTVGFNQFVLVDGVGAPSCRSCTKVPSNAITRGFSLTSLGAARRETLGMMPLTVTSSSPLAKAAGKEEGEGGRRNEYIWVLGELRFELGVWFFTGRVLSVFVNLAPGHLKELFCTNASSELWELERGFCRSQLITEVIMWAGLFKRETRSECSPNREHLLRAWVCSSNCLYFCNLSHPRNSGLFIKQSRCCFPYSDEEMERKRGLSQCFFLIYWQNMIRSLVLLAHIPSPSSQF